MNKSSVSCLARGFFLPIFDEKALPWQAAGPEVYAALAVRLRVRHWRSIRVSAMAEETRSATGRA